MKLGSSTFLSFQQAAQIILMTFEKDPLSLFGFDDLVYDLPFVSICGSAIFFKAEKIRNKICTQLNIGSFIYHS